MDRGRALSLLVGVVVVVVGVVLVERNAVALGTAVSRIGLGPIIGSGALSVLGLLLIGRVWLALARGLGLQAPVVQSQGVFFLSQVGKYVPGSVWPFLLQMQLGRRWGTPRRTMLSANILMLALVAATGLICGVALLPWSSRDGLTRYWWTIPFLVPLLVCLHPRTIPAVLDWIFARLGREPLQTRLTGRAMLTATAWSFAVWVVMGLHLLVLTSNLGGSGAKAMAAAIGGMGLGWAAGLIFIPAPAGAGVRDVILVATFTPEIGAASALTVALASRVLLLIGDVVLAGIGAAVTHVGAGRGARGSSAGPGAP